MNIEAAIRETIRDAVAEALGDHPPERKRYNLQDAYEAKGGMPWSTFRTNSIYHPRGGEPDAYWGGKRVWYPETIERWLDVDDVTLEDYLIECGKRLTPAMRGRLRDHRERAVRAGLTQVKTA